MSPDECRDAGDVRRGHRRAAPGLVRRARLGPAHDGRQGADAIRHEELAGCLGDPTAEPPDRPVSPPAAEPDPYLAGLDKKRAELRLRRTELLLEYTERHPDVVQIDRQLEQLRIERHTHLRQQQKSQEN